jgi:tRNA A-37 threonylcarbamoyl transferase component Bud32/ABC-type phosphate/phosphonate transport system substrate-binding protein/membrane-associated phospholipid phosphatase
MTPTLPDPIDRLKASLSDRYAIEREIGRGGMATVYLARDLKHERRVALKVLRPELSTALGAQRFLREVRIAARLQHPHIVPIFDSGEAGGLLYCVMPYVEGQTLRELLEREKRLPLEDALQIARNVAHALSYAHAHGIIHRDIKPENILISQGYAVVADFGIARALTEAGGEGLTQTGIAIGTPTYMSPEQLEAGAQIDGRSDLYSLGCVLYEMLAGQPPFTGPSVQVIMARHLMDPVPSLRSARSEVPEPLESAIARSLAKAPAERFSTGEQFVNALATPVTTPPDQPVAVLPDWVTPSFFAELRRRRVDRAAVLYAAITLGAVLVAGLIFRALDFPAWAFHVVVVAAVIGLPVSLVLAWMYDLTAEGLRRTTPMRLKWTPPDSARLEVTPTTPTEAAWETEETVLMRTPERVHEEDRVLTPGQAVGAAVPMVDEGVSLLDSRLGLISLLGVALLVNWVETALETWVSANLDVVSEFRHQAAYAVHWIEGFYHFDYHDVTNALATYGYSSAYFFVWPLLFVLVGFALARREDISAFRVFSFAALIDYAISLPFFILFPVPERWAYSGSGAMLLSDRWSSQLIELVRPLSALDNCFPSFHVSLTVVIILSSFLYRLRLRRSVAALGLTIILSTFVLGIHWLADIIAGLAVGTLSVVLALRLNERVAGPAVPTRQPFTVKMGRVTLTCLAAVLSLASSVSAAPQHEVTFIEVALDEETRRADGQLRAYLEEKAGIVAVSERPMEYDVVIDRLAGWDLESKGDFLARMTPYALVAAELLGADLEILATYVSRATGSTTYHSYFVVNQDRFSYTPELATLVEFLKDQESPASFIYHNRFSTSSYFLPALFFREHGIFNMAQSTEYHTAIHSKKLGNSSSDLVRGVAAGQYDLAAVWDGTKTKFESPGDLYEEYGSRVHFVQLPTELPNDLLVASAAMDSSILTRIRVAIDSMAPDQIDEGDFLTWRNINEAPDARRALANLRWLARERPAPVTVDVRASSSDETPVPQEYLEAARQAVRLSGTEFVNYDGDFHAHRDYIWTLSPIHDGAVLVTSRIAGSDIDDQEFQISFRDTEDLTRRIGNLIHTRLHRIRYVWPYRTEHPTVIRDVGFNMPLDASVKVRKITWLDAPRNLFLEDAEFDANVSHADFYKFELYPDFATASGDDVFGFDAMSNVSYRVILVREVRERAIFRILTVVFVVLLATAALAALADLRRRKPEVTSGP